MAKSQVKAQGTTIVSEKFGSDLVKITIQTKNIDIGRPSQPIPPKLENSCTYSRHPCSLVQKIEIQVNDKELFIPRSVFTDLSDFNNTILSKSKDNFVLLISSGDASESLQIKITFNRIRVISREMFVPDEQNSMIQETRYFESQN